MSQTHLLKEYFLITESSQQWSAKVYKKQTGKVSQYDWCSIANSDISNQYMVTINIWRHLLFWHCLRTQVRRYISTINVDKLIRLWTPTVHLKENGFTLIERLRRWSTTSQNTPLQAESLLLSPEQTTRYVYMNADKTEFICLNEDLFSFLRGKPLKLVIQFAYLGSNISSIESNINVRIRKAWTDINRLSIIMKSDLYEKKKKMCQYYFIDSQSRLKKHIEKKSRWELHENARCCFEHILVAAPGKTATAWPLASLLTNYPRKTNKTLWSLLEK